VAWLWFSVVVLAAALALLYIRRSLWPRRLEKRLLYPLAVVERCLQDALGELCAGDEEDDLLVSPFEPIALSMARIPESDLVAFGPRAVENHRRLVAAIRAWNAAAGKTSRPAALLPTVLAAHQAARELSEQLPARALGPARDRAGERVLMALVGPAEPGEEWIH